MQRNHRPYHRGQAELPPAIDFITPQIMQHELERVNEIRAQQERTEAAAKRHRRNFAQKLRAVLGLH